MRFTVTRPVGTKDSEFETYARLLRQNGKKLGNLPRVPDPENPTRRWVCAWDTKEEAQRFANNLKKQTGNKGWRVEPTTVSPSHGPFGPIVVQLARRGDGLIFALHPLSFALIQEAFKNTTPVISNAFINTETWNNFRNMHRPMSDLVQGVIPALTGLSMEQLTDLGYAVIDDETWQSWLYVPPAAIANGQT